MHTAAGYLRLIVVLVLGLTGPAAFAGDRLGVTAALHPLTSSWGAASFSIDVDGVSKEGEVLVGQPVRVEYEASLPGYLTYVRISSHGDITLQKSARSEASSQGTDSLPVAAPLGSEEVLALFSSAPLAGMLIDGAASSELGSDRSSAEHLIGRLSQAQSAGIQIAVRRITYMVSTPAGETEYTTRSIIRRVEEAPHSSSKDPAKAAVATIPSRVQFEFDSDRLTNRGKRDLDVFGEALVTKLRTRSVVLEGHTDSIGTDEYNMDLSLRRAQAARIYLAESFGLPAAQLTAVGKGKMRSAAPNESEAQRSLDRRVDFVFLDSNR